MTMDARELVAANRYMTLATADASGRPWISPVWFAPDHDGFLWISRPESRHSRNLAERPELALVIFDSTARPAERQALYVRAVAERLSGERRDTAVARYSEYSVADGLESLSVDEVTAPHTRCIAPPSRPRTCSRTSGTSVSPSSSEPGSSSALNLARLAHHASTSA